METFLFRCPLTGQKVQGWAPKEDKDDDSYRLVTCHACKQSHLVNPRTGKTPSDR